MYHVTIQMNNEMILHKIRNGKMFEYLLNVEYLLVCLFFPHYCVNIFFFIIVLYLLTRV